MKLIGLDVGTKRIGVAKADSSTKIAVPDGFVNVNDQEFAEIARIARMYSTSTFVVGLPRNNSGEETKQSLYVRNFARQLAMSIPNARIYFEDESLTSVEAERRLKQRKKNFQKGEIDAEAASIILQDFLERLISNGKIAENAYTSEQAKIENDAEVEADPDNKTTVKKMKKTGKKPRKVLKTILITLITLIVLGGVGFGGAWLWYNNQLLPVVENANCKFKTPEEEASSTDTDETDGCRYKQFTVKDNDTSAVIAENLKESGLIRSDLAFKIYVKLNRPSLKYGIYNFREAMSTEEIISRLTEGAPTDNVFNITVLPGETVEDVKKKLLDYGYNADDIKYAFEKQYKNKVLKGLYDESGNLTSVDQPRSVQLEGYIFGDTYQFYKEENLEKIVSTMINALGDVVDGNDLEAKFKEKGLTLREGIILASIVQKEAKTADMNRLRIGMSLGSDVTATYAADLADPYRTKLVSNADVLAFDSLYNTRRHTGLTPGPISNPGVEALKAVATGDDSKRSMLFFLTGDDGKMYYSDTEAGHNQNIRDHCQILCNVAL